jgi:hypothetical protein
MNETDPDIPDDILLYDAAMGVPPSAVDDAFVEFLRVMLHRYGRDKSAANCCRSPRGFRCPMCHPEDYRRN